MRGRAFFLSAAITSAALVACSGTASTDILATDGDAATDARADGGKLGADGSAGGDGAAGNGDSGAGGGSDAQAGTDSGGGACTIPAGGPNGEGGTTCNGVIIGGSPITTTCHMGMPPQPSGGTILDGRYVLDQLDYYGDPGQCPVSPERIVWQICGSSWATVQEHDLSTNYYSATVMQSAGAPTSLTLDVSCPQAQSVMDGYIATPTSLTLFITFGTNAVRLDRFKRL